MYYDRRRAEGCVDESARHALANAGGREIVGKKEGEQKGSARGSVHRKGLKTICHHLRSPHWVTVCRSGRRASLAAARART